MMRLVQGDVGSGKTIVAAIAAAQSIDNNAQVAFMAPTTLLAEQHFINLQSYFPDYKESIALLTSSTKAKEKAKIKNGLKSGSIKLVIGTHALFQDYVSFLLLGLIVIDEQHRFGVNQRLSLRSKNIETAFHELIRRIRRRRKERQQQSAKVEAANAASGKKSSFWNYCNIL